MISRTHVGDQRVAAKTEALRLFAAMSSSERWAYWADECSLWDLFERQIPRDTRIKLNELINTWIADPEEHP